MKYTIKKGDTLSGIAKANNTTVSDLAKINNIENPNVIYAGATIEIPSAAQPSAGSLQNAAAGAVTAKTDPGYTSSKPTYSVSEDVKAAQSALENWEQSKPDAYESPYAARIEEMLGTVLGRGEFSYDPASDPVYNYYRERYINDGKKAMRDTAGEAAALTGGYGNSYAVSAGEAAYDAYLTKLSNVIPTLMEAAYKRYSDKLSADRNDLETLLGLEKTDYSRYRDSISDYNDLGDYLYKKYTDLSDYDYDAFLSELKQWNEERDYERKVYEDERDAAYERERDAVADRQWESEMALSREKLAASIAAAEKKAAEAKKSSTKSSSNKEFSYYNCGAEARAILDKLMSRTVYDDSGHLKTSMIDYLKKVKSEGTITTEEYNYIRSIVG